MEPGCRPAVAAGSVGVAHRPGQQASGTHLIPSRLESRAVAPGYALGELREVAAAVMAISGKEGVLPGGVSSARLFQFFTMSK